MTLQKTLSTLWLAAALLGTASWMNKGRLPAGAAILREAQTLPLQTPTERQPFSFSYRGRPYDVRPLADYALTGILVSHNDIGSIADIYHDDDAVDTKDVCVAWGAAAANPELPRVTFSNGPFTCYFKYPGDMDFKNNDVSNNHLLTDDPAVREKVKSLRVGDQIRFKGMLVSYRPADQPDNWRTSSLTRGDTGPGACEVVFVKELEVLSAGTPGWYNLWRGCLAALFGLPLLKFALTATGVTGRP
jgi:hypothetical protein